MTECTGPVEEFIDSIWYSSIVFSLWIVFMITQFHIYFKKGAEEKQQGSRSPLRSLYSLWDPLRQRDCDLGLYKYKWIEYNVQTV